MKTDSPRTVAERVEQLADEMGRRWEAGDFRLAEKFLHLHPELRDSVEAVLELVAEELTLRDEYRQPTTLLELESRFPQWRPQIQALWDCQQVLGPRLLPPAFPEPGERLGEFDLQSELGRGLHGRVYRATQSTLANRTVVLKVSPATGDEHLSLARLQHSNIVPLYSAHDFPGLRLRGLCLPYFGGCTLADLQEKLSPASVAELFPAAPRELFGPDVVCRIGLALADALQYAHDRSILHLDVKPSNVLIAADGVPMLLDFHLARPPLATGDIAPDWLGGTSEYMAAEHQAAMACVRENKPIEQPVDGRADIFSLGVTLREFASKTGSALSPGVADILARCTAAAAIDRYPSAAALASDLRRHLADEPLQGVRNRSWRERWAKWRRRRPVVLPMAVVLATVGLTGLGLSFHADRLRTDAKAAFADGQLHLNNSRPTEALEFFRSAERLLQGLPFQSTLRAEIRAAKRAAERTIAKDELLVFTDRARFLSVSEGISNAQTQRLQADVQAVWDRREQLIEEFGRDWPELYDLGLILANLQSRVAPADARRTLDGVESLLGSTTALEHERARLQDATAKPSSSMRSRSAWDHVWAGRSLLFTGQAELAVKEFDAALQLEPQSLWANYYRGVGLLRLSRSADALTAFTACIVAAPRAAWCRYNRALANQQLHRLADARHDLTAALELDSAFWPARWELAAVAMKQNAPADAIAELRQAYQLGAPAAETHYRTAVVRLAMREDANAMADLRACLKLEPNHTAASRLLQELTKKN